MTEFTTAQLLEQFEHDLNRSVKAIERLTIKPTKHAAGLLKRWSWFRDLCLATLEHLQELEQLKKES